jgi:hypothetical protein
VVLHLMQLTLVKVGGVIRRDIAYLPDYDQTGYGETIERCI